MRAATLGAAIATVAAVTQPSMIGAVAVSRSTWMAMTVSVQYDRPGPGDTLELRLDVRRLTGRRLDFSPARTALPPGSGTVALATTFHGILPPPTPIVLHLEVSNRAGRVVLQRDCELHLVNLQGKEAWAGDLVRAREAAGLAWRVSACR